ncbi:dihydroxyacetone kinase, partial [Rhizobium ruizarguesonis]
VRLDAEREAALAAAVESHAWMPAVERHEIRIIAAPRASAGLNGANGKAGENDRNRRLITALCEHLTSQESELNRLDGRVGDGDTGSTVATGARSVLAR